MATTWFSAPAPVARRVRGYFAPVNRTAQTPVLFDPSEQGGFSLDAPPARWPDYFSSWRLRDVREIILHVITETAVHAGHLDAARELLDGRTWLGPEGTRIPRG